MLYRSALTSVANVTYSARVRRHRVWILAALVCATGAGAWRTHERAAGFVPVAIGLDRVTLNADFDGDGQLDEVALEGFGDDSSVRVSVSSDRGQRLLASLHESLTIAAFDYDNDGDIDILVTSKSGALTIWNNDGEARFRVIKRDDVGHLGAVVLTEPLSFGGGNLSSRSANAVPPGGFGSLPEPRHRSPSTVHRSTSAVFAPTAGRAPPTSV
jgi:hypothetical protein